jgi:hypothetical protein
MAGRATTEGARTAGGGRTRAAVGWTVKALVLLAIGGADCRSRGVSVVSEVDLVDGTPPAAAVRILGQAGAVPPGGAVTRSVHVACPKPGGPDTVTVRWTPPQGATGLSFPTLQPVNPLGPAPYEFTDVVVVDSNDPDAEPSLAVGYSAPAPPLPSGGATFVECFTAVLADGSEHSASFADAVAGSDAAAGPAVAGAEARHELDPAPVPPVAGRSADASMWWQAALTLQPPAEVPLSETLCQEWAAFLQDPSFFVAIRVPAAADATDPRSAPIPLVVPDLLAPERASIELRTTGGLPATVFAAALELRPERLGLAASVLPPAGGERWMTLGVSPEPPLSCPGGLAGAWDLHAELAFDLGGNADWCRECVLEQYFCYEGSTPPFFFVDTASAAVRVSAEAAVQRSGVTCTGPIPLRLAGEPPQPPITLEGSELRRANANSLVKLAHTLRAWLADQEQTDVTLAVSSSRGVPWSLYSDSALQHPIQGPVTISGSAQFDFWASTKLPFGFRGPESVTVTASPSQPPGGSAWVADHLWAGAWTAPPPAIALSIESATLYEGAPVRVSGTLPVGSYRLVVVPNGAWVPGECFAGEVLADVDVTASETTLPPTVVWPAATTGSFDVLALSGPCPTAIGAAGPAEALAAGDVHVVASMDSSLAAGVEVTVAPTPLRRRLRRTP